MITRIIVYALLVAVILGSTWFHGYTHAELNNMEVQAKHLQDEVRIVVKTNTVIREVENETDKGLQKDLRDIRVAYDSLRSEHAESESRLSATIGHLLSCTGNVDPARVLDDVETAILGIMETGDTEIAKYRRLWQRDSEVAKRVSP